MSHSKVFGNHFRGLYSPSKISKDLSSVLIVCAQNILDIIFTWPRYVQNYTKAASGNASLTYILTAYVVICILKKKWHNFLPGHGLRPGSDINFRSLYSLQSIADIIIQKYTSCLLNSL